MRIHRYVLKYPESDKFAKSELLDILVGEKHAINKELVLCKKIMKSFQDDIRKNKLEINLFEVTMYLFAQYAHSPLPLKSSVVDSLMLKHSVIGTLRSRYESLYESLIESVIVTYEEFTQLDSVGGSRDDLMKEYVHMLDTLVYLVNTPRPFNTVQNLLILPAFILDILNIYYGLDQFSTDFILKCSEQFNEEFAMDIGHLMLLLTQLEKDAKKLKKNKPNFEQGVKEFLQTYMMIVLELRSRQPDRA